MTQRSPTGTPPHESASNSSPSRLRWLGKHSTAPLIGLAALFRPCRFCSSATLMLNFASPLRAVTVGLNPSLHEFPAREPFRRFPLAEGNRESSRYLDAMSAYFRTDPYSAWFNAFEPLLNGLGASYYTGAASTALHTDICSPVATDPTWSRLDKADRATLEADGGRLWRILLEELRPQIVAISVAKAHLERIEFSAISDWKIVHTFRRKADDKPRSRPYEIRGRWYDVGGEPSLFGFGTAALKPFQLLADCQKRQTGQVLLQEYQDGR